MNKRKTNAQIFLVIPVIVALVLTVFFITALVSPITTDNGAPIQLMIWVYGSMLAPIPCFAFSAVGMICALQVKQEEGGMTAYIAAGIAEIVIELLCMVFWAYVMLTGM